MADPVEVSAESPPSEAPNEPKPKRTRTPKGAIVTPKRGKRIETVEVGKATGPEPTAKGRRKKEPEPEAPGRIKVRVVVIEAESDGNGEAIANVVKKVKEMA